MDLTQVFTSPSQWTKHHLSIDDTNCLLGRLLVKMACLNEYTHTTWEDMCSQNAVILVAKASCMLFPERMKLDIDAHLSSRTDRDDVVRFNDHPDTTFEDIQKVLQQAEYLKNLPNGV